MVNLAGRPRPFGPVLAAAVLLAAGLLVPYAGGATTLYKWVDADGVVHYSDQPHAGAEKIQVARAQSYKAPPPAKPVAPSSAARAAASSSMRYQRLQITSPADGDVLVNTGGSAQVSVDVEPGLAPGHQLWFTLDGQRVDGLAPDATSGTLGDLERGTHTLSLTIVDANGTPVQSADSVTFTVRQPSSLHPNQPKPAPH